MMQSLVGVIPAIDAGMIDEKTSLRFKDKSQFKTPEALIIHEQRVIDDERLLDACQREYNLILHTPTPRYVPVDVQRNFEK